MITWGECTVDWGAGDVMTRITHQPTGIYVEPNVNCDGSSNDGIIIRDKWLKKLDEKVREGRS